MRDEKPSRRELFRRGRDLGAAALVLPAMLPGVTEAAGLDSTAGFAAEAATATTGAAAAIGMKVGPEMYESIGVKPLINARGTFTIVSGSTMLPEVRAAMDAASRRYVHMDELMDAAGARLATLTGAEWGLITCGCSAALTHATAACIAGGNPDLHVRIPNLQGFPKDEVIIPKHSRNVYDAAIRAVGARVVEVDSMAELEAAIGPRTAMIYVFAGPRVDAGPLTLKAMASIAQPKGVPILVDAAAEILTVPNVHLQNGATLVGYSGGKCLRGPQTAGMLLGRKDLVKAAWVHSAPHHGYARALKIGKEETMGMLMAVEMWLQRDHEAETKAWASWLDTIAKKMATIPGVTTQVQQPEGLSNKTPSLRVLWDRKQFGLSGEAVSRALFEGTPRITMSPTRGDSPAQTGVGITPYMMAAGEEIIVADKLHAAITSPPAAFKDPATPPAAPAGDVSGRWDVQIQYAASKSTHTLQLRQKGGDIDGSHQGDFVTREISGTLEGDTLRLRSGINEDHGDSINCTFSGKVTGDAISGTLDMGEYRSATFTAARRARGTRGSA